MTLSRSTRRLRTWLLQITALVLVASCSPETVGDSSENPDDLMPSECVDLGSPFLEADCLGALAARCGALESEQECVAAKPLSFGDGGYPIHCGWAKVVRFADIDMCTVESVSGRCVAGLEQNGIGCDDPCAGELDLYSSLSVEFAELEMIEMPCAPGGAYLGGPLGPSSAVDSPPTDGSGSCAENTSPPPSELCACHQVACEAE